MVSQNTANLTRADIEKVVRETVYKELGLPLPRTALAPNPLVVNVSARHAHLTQETVETIFGKGHQLTPIKDLYQDGYFAAKETITLIGPRNRMIENLRILGPCRGDNQIELAFSDSINLGFNIPTRTSGDVAGSTGGMIKGPKGFYEMDQGIIRAAPHVHMSPEDAAFYGVQNGDTMKLKIGGSLPMTFENIVVRMGDGIKLEIHIDTDEGNACNLKADTPCELIK